MSSDQYSDKPLPPQKKECPRCGELMPPNAPRCWLCLELFRAPVGKQTETLVPKRKPVRPRTGAWGDEAVFVGLGILAIFLCVAFAVEMPGMLMLLAVVLAPALVRTTYQIIRTNSATEVRSPDRLTNFATMLLSSVGVVAFVGFVAIHASWGAFIVACFPALAINAGGESMSVFMTITIGAGVIAMIAVSIWLFRYFWSMQK